MRENPFVNRTASGLSLALNETRLDASESSLASAATEPSEPSYVASWFNVTFITYALILTLTAIGVSAVYSSSAAIVASRENRARMKRQKQEQLASISVRASTDQLAPWFADYFDEVASPSYHSASFLWKQLAWGALGLIALMIFSRIDYHVWRRLSPYLLAITFCLLFAVFIPGLGRKINGASRWVGFGPITLQPSELAKLAMVLFMARQLSVHRAHLHKLIKGFVPHVLILGVFALMIVKEPDLGATACLCLIAFAMFFAAGAKISHLTGLVLMGIPVVALELMVPYRRARLLAFLSPEEYLRTHAYQLNQSLIAIGSGGVTGKGLGAGPQKYQFLSTAFSDFIYATIGEETGMIGAATVATLFLALFITGWIIAFRAPDFYGMLVAVGVTVMFTLSAFIHMYVNTGLVPTKGLTLPFISAGGSSLLINLTAAGILINVARQGELHRAGAVSDRRSSGDEENPYSAEAEPETLVLRRQGQSRELPRPMDLPNIPETN